ncbi:MAG: ATP-grasp domain-containing protein [Patescibacteria group bacterium]
MKKINILVTASSGDIGQGVIKSLRMFGRKMRIIATDINAESCGLFLADKGYIIEPVLGDEKKFLKDIITICNKEKIDIVFSCFEAEQIVIAKNVERLKASTKAYFVVQPEKVLDICNQDKLATYRFLSKNNIRVPETYTTKNGADKLIKKYGWPLVLKPRHGSGSKDFYIIKNKKELDKKWPNVSNPIIQEYIDNGKDEEYTVGVFLTKDSRALGAITMLRKLKFGMTWHAIANHQKDMADVAKKTAESVGAIGPCNVQLRRDKNHQPCVIEINARISSTTIFRAMLGFNEALAAIDYFLENKRPALDYKDGFIMRLFGEHIVPQLRYAKLKKQGRITNI